MIIIYLLRIINTHCNKFSPDIMSLLAIYLFS